MCHKFSVGASIRAHTHLQVILFLQRYAFLLKDARIFWKMFEGEDEKQVYPRLHDMLGKKDTP